MAKLTMTAIARLMRKLDFCMMVTQTGRGTMNCRPMSNNKDVTYKGDSYFFTDGSSKKVGELKSNSKVMLTFEDSKGLFIGITGTAKLIRSKTEFEKHWQDSLDQWFEKGIDTPGIVLIHVKGKKIRYWQKEKEGEISIR